MISSISTPRRVFAEPNLGCAAISSDGATDVLMLQYRGPGRPVDDGRPLGYEDLFARVHENGDSATAADLATDGTTATGLTTMNDFVFEEQPPSRDARFEIVDGQLWYVS